MFDRGCGDWGLLGDERGPDHLASSAGRHDAKERSARVMRELASIALLKSLRWAEEMVPHISEVGREVRDKAQSTSQRNPLVALNPLWGDAWAFSERRAQR